MTSSPLLQELLATELASLTESYAQALHGLADTHYPERPLAELRSTCGSNLTTLQALIRDDAEAPVAAFVEGITELRWPMGFSLAEIVRALLMIKPLVRTRLFARAGGSPRLGDLQAAEDRLDAAVEVLVGAFTASYQARTTADLEQQLAEVRALRDQLLTLATYDALTGLYNYRVFAERLREEVRRSSRYGRPLSLLMADVDDFKAVNDRFGHPAGNAVLQAVAGILLTQMRGTDVVARYGGEEFAVLLPETALPAAACTGEKVRAAVAAWRSSILPAVTISVGVSAYGRGDADGTGLLHAADSALYAAKQGGRDQVVAGQP